MTNRELIRLLLDEPMDSPVYLGKGMGLVGRVEEKITDRIYLVLSL